MMIHILLGAALQSNLNDCNHCAVLSCRVYIVTDHYTLAAAALAGAVWPGLSRAHLHIFQQLTAIRPPIF